MFEAARMMYIYVETPLHAGTGRSVGAVDLPIQRERVTGYPIIQSSSVKGQLRAIARSKKNTNQLEESVYKAMFGPEAGGEIDHAGALAPGDAKLLLFPVRALAGVFAWTTSLEILERFRRDLMALPGITAPSWNLPAGASIADGVVWLNGKECLAGNKVVLEEFSFDADQTQAAFVKEVAAWLSANALPQAPEYAYWRESLPKRLIILNNSAFRDFTLFATEVQTHVQLKTDTKTVKDGALWTEESLPADTLLYAPLCSTPSRNDIILSGLQILDKIAGLKISRMQLGGDETTGRGMVSVRM
jgi:CRISPR-associated protein Cmr4